MNTKCTKLAVIGIVCISIFLLCASRSFAARDPYIGVWTFPNETSEEGAGGRALILEKKAFGLADDWKDRAHQTPISGTWMITNGVLVLKVQHSEIGEIQENTEIRWKIVVTNDTMRITPDDSTPEETLTRLPSRYDRSVIYSLRAKYKVKEEFKYEPAGDFPTSIPKKIIEGSYFGKTQLNGKEYYHYQFLDILKGKDRCLNLYLEVQAMVPNGKQYLDGLAREEQYKTITNTRPALFFYHYHPSYDTNEVLSYVSGRGFSASEMKEYPHYISGWVWDYEGTFICYPPYDWSQIDSWNCKIDVKKSR